MYDRAGRCAGRQRGEPNGELRSNRGRSPEAKRDVEVYRLVDTEGLTPLLSLLSEATLEQAKRTTEHASAEAEKKQLQLADQTKR